MSYNKLLTLDSIQAANYKDLELRFLGGKYVRKLERNVAKNLKSNFVFQVIRQLHVYIWP